ncbi:MAG: tetratricopeptide repeat protein [bacterium]|nr:tetratricopeptide repeat protein [bacterium]
MSDALMASLTAQLRKLNSSADKSEAQTPRMLPGERREIAILFLDLKGFTQLSEKLQDPEMIHLIVNGPDGVMTTLHKIVEFHGGYVDKYEGDLIMALFGARQASENDCHRAVSCGMKLMEAVATIDDALSGLGVRIGARCGINFGWVTFGPDPSGHDTAMGSAVNIASRMESTAEVNTVQATNAVVRATQDYFLWENLGDILVKGLEKPVHAYRVIGYGDLHKARWERTSWMQHVPMVGHAEELKALLEHWNKFHFERELNPRGGVKHTMIGLRGEPGIGKSRLVFEFLKRTQSEQNFLLLHGHTMSVAQSPYYMWACILRDLFHIASEKPDQERFQFVFDEFLRQADVEKHPNIPRLFPYLSYVLGLPVPELEAIPDSIRIEQIKLALRDCFLIIAHTKFPIVFFLDDLHWVDSSSQELLEFLVANSDTENPFFFLGTYRPDRDDGTPIEFKLHPGYVNFQEIPIPPLTEEQTTQHIAEILQGYLSNSSTTEIPIESQRIVYYFSHGNPFFTEELILDWLETGELYNRDGIWIFEPSAKRLELPNSITSLVRARVDRLPVETKLALQQCSVIGLDFSLRLFQRVKNKLSLSDNAAPLLNDLVFRDFLRSISSLHDAMYKFKLTTTKSVAYSTLLMNNRSLLHRLTAESIEELFDNDRDMNAGILAEHWHLANEVSKSLKYGITALRWLRRGGNNREAATLYEKLLRWLPETAMDPNDQFAVHAFDLLKLAEAIANSLGDRVTQKVHLAKLSLFVQSDRFKKDAAMIINRWGNFCYVTGDFEAARTYYEECVTVSNTVHDEKSAAHATGNIGLIAMHDKQYEEAEARFVRAIQQFIQLQDEYSLNLFELNLAGMCFLKGEIERSTLLLEKVQERAHRLQDRNGEARVWNNLSLIQLHQGQLDAAITSCLSASKIYREIGERKSEGIVLTNLARLYQKTQETAKSRKYYADAILIHQEVGNSIEEKKAQAELAALSR